MKVLVLDNYDSFTYNLVQLARENTAAEIHVFRNDEIALEEVEAYDKIILSPGPGLPSEAGILCELVQEYKDSKPILGVCLGMQAIGEVLGARLLNMEAPLHGRSSHILHDSDRLLKDIPSPFEAARYHSWVLDGSTIPHELVVTAIDCEKNPMSIEHRSLPIFGVQFHPESILTSHGKNMIINFLNNDQ